jgi:hypothetical protein
MQEVISDCVFKTDSQDAMTLIVEMDMSCWRKHIAGGRTWMWERL